MNALDKDPTGDLAVVRYGDGEITVLRPGRFVLCAVSGKRVPLEDLKYWNPALQEAYAGPAEALERWRQLNP
ncbi:MAG TPA: DUF2093 domain-containing protein [Phenylobacterium sp.]|jgi:hypothetical protein|uniref:DUF2093 domain-containing protein n=1 Tax=Phenylobacterium sp. TaxID=1871053 RepID=UPI002D39864A|nr:DUF2093 domain-containing protein [Phenylobacterium sp.]HZZ67595.1 DUF2093 domain-containing protein [Phenylobacterium sp.]